MTKHTQGPWVLQQPDKWPFDLKVVASDDQGIVHIARHAHSTAQRSLADCLEAVGFPHEERGEVIAVLRQQMANARLIAAAPELLAYAECAAAMDFALVDPGYDPQPVLRSHGWGEQENPSLFLSRIRRDAITKAVGHYLGRDEVAAA